MLHFALLMLALLARAPAAAAAPSGSCPEAFARVSVPPAPFVSQGQIRDFFAKPKGAISHYTSSTGFKEIYAGLKQPPGSSSRLASLKTLEKIELELLQRERVTGPLHSGGILSERTIEGKFKVGSIVENDYLVSATPDPTVAKKFAEFYRRPVGWLKRVLFERERVLFSIDGKTGRSVADVSH
ncbi:MAG: hypothetical protein HUU37_06450, partial [Bdellovibrionales bacterium]|nr:hypothetical protein [Bdellovibrionales bacterium]